MLKVRDVISGSFFSKKRGLDLSPAVQGIRLGSPTSEANLRRKRCRHSLEQFCLTYLPKHFDKGFSELHGDLFRACNKRPGKMILNRRTGKIKFKRAKKGKRVARIAPRKFGKTTIISLALPLWELAFRRKWFILLIGEAAGTAESNLQTIVAELESNPLLLEDFPHLRPAKDKKNQYEKWTDREIRVASGATVMAKGLGARMRGMKKRHQRPDLAILDDPESPETADTFLKRARHKRWFGGTFMGLGADNWDVFVIGNLPHRDCLIASLVRSKEWDGSLWRAINVHRKDELFPIGNTKTDGTALWPQVWSLEALENYKREPEVGALQFAREMMNDPRVEESKPFDPSDFTYFDWTPDRLRDYEDIATIIDPAGGEKPGEFKKGKRDWACIVTAGRHKSDGWIEIFSVVLTRGTPDRQINKLLDEYGRFRARLVCEENMYKNLIAPTIMKAALERRFYPSIKAVQRTGQQNKITRILGVQPQVADKVVRVVRFARHLQETVPSYFGMWDDFPGDFDDGPDATETAIRELERPLTYGHLGGPTGKSYWKNAA